MYDTASFNDALSQFLVSMHNLSVVAAPSLNEFANTPVERIQPQHYLFRRYDKTGLRGWFYRQAFQILDPTLRIIRSSEDLSNANNRIPAFVQTKRMN